MNLSYINPIVWYCKRKDRLIKTPTQLCSLNLSYFRPILRYCILQYRFLKVKRVKDAMTHDLENFL